MERTGTMVLSGSGRPGEEANKSLLSSHKNKSWQKSVVKCAKTVILVAPIFVKRIPKISIAIVVAEVVISVVETWMEEKDNI